MGIEMLKSTTAISFLLFGLTACAGDITMKPERRAQIKNVAVISVVGDKISHELYPFIINLPERFSGQVDWHFDEIVRTVAQEGLKTRQPQITITQFRHNSSNLAEQIYKIAESEAYADPERISENLREITAETTVDAIILLSGGGHIGDRICTFGAFILNSTSALVPTSVGVCLTAFVLDGKTLTVLSKQSDAQWSDYNRGGIFGPIDPAPFSPAFRLPLTEEQSAFLRPKYEQWLREATDNVLRKSGF